MYPGCLCPSRQPHFHFLKPLPLSSSPCPKTFPPSPITWQPHPFTYLPCSDLTFLAHLPSSSVLKVFTRPFVIHLLSVHRMLFSCIFFLLLNFCHPNLNLKLDQTLPSFLCQYLPVSLSLPMNHWNHPAASSVCIWVLSLLPCTASRGTWPVPALQRQLCFAEDVLQRCYFKWRFDGSALLCLAAILVGVCVHFVLCQSSIDLIP